MPKDPISSRNKRIELVKKIVQEKKKVHISAIYSALLSTHGVSRKTIDSYIDDLIYMGLITRNDDHLIWVHKNGDEK